MAGERRVVWRCWKCNAVLAEMQGTFEQPEISTWKVSWQVLQMEKERAGVCGNCKAYNVLQPAGMHARLQEEEIE